MPGSGFKPSHPAQSLYWGDAFDPELYLSAVKRIVPSQIVNPIVTH